MAPFVIVPGGGDWPGPGEWKYLWTWDGQEATDEEPRLSATLGCPDCGVMARLTDHEIGEDGKVHPSVVCPVEVCNFHEVVKLEGWNPDQRREGGEG